MNLAAHDIHIWSVDVEEILPFALKNREILSQEEQQRMMRLRAAQDQQRFISTHVVLRLILSSYLNIAPQEILFAKTAHGKPFIQATGNQLNFNLSHSGKLAVYALTLDYAIGIDIEKIYPRYQPSLATRFFSKQENKELKQLSEEEQIKAFYKIWSKKEAIVKAVGHGIANSLSRFSVSFNKDCEEVAFENIIWNLQSIPIHVEYESALATNQAIGKISHWPFTNC